MDLADRVIRGDFGNGEERKRNLGPLYGFVQNDSINKSVYSLFQLLNNH